VKRCADNTEIGGAVPPWQIELPNLTKFILTIIDEAIRQVLEYSQEKVIPFVSYLEPSDPRLFKKVGDLQPVTG
jgi:hypothetical protein